MNRWIVVLCLASGAQVARGQDVTATELRSFLTTTIGLGDADLRAGSGAESVTHVLPSRDDRDVALFGMVTINAPLQAITAFLTDNARALAAPGRTFGVLRDSASVHEFAGITLTEDEARSLRTCHTGSCSFKLSAEEMTRAAGAEGARGATQFVQEYFEGIATAYRRSGNVGMPFYSDYGKRTIAAADAFMAIVGDNPLFHFAPGLREYLTTFPHAELPRAHDEIFWEVDQLPGLKTTAAMSQRVVYAPSEQGGVTVAATKQIVADHYLEAGLEIVVAMEAPESGGTQTHLLFLRQYRFDHMPKALFVSLRGRVVSKLRERAAADLARYRSEIGK